MLICFCNKIEESYERGILHGSVSPNWHGYVAVYNKLVPVFITVIKHEVGHLTNYLVQMSNYSKESSLELPFRSLHSQ